MHDNSLLVFIAIALVVGICLGVLIGAWWVTRPYRIPAAERPTDTRPRLRVVGDTAEWR